METLVRRVRLVPFFAAAAGCLLGALSLLLTLSRPAPTPALRPDFAQFADDYDARVISGLDTVAVPIQDDVLLDQRKILLFGKINPVTSRHVVTRLFHLNARDPKKPIELYLRTNGGLFHDAFAIVDAMRQIDAPVNVTAMGGCESAGCLILTAATGKRRATPHTTIAVHNSIDDAGSQVAHSEDAVDLSRVEEHWRSYARLPSAFFPMTGDHFYFMQPEEALTLGLIDEIVKPRQAERRAPQ